MHSSRENSGRQCGHLAPRDESRSRSERTTLTGLASNALDFYTPLPLRCVPFGSRLMVHFSRTAMVVLMGLMLLSASGCVRRRLNVRSNPPGALVYVDNQQIGTTPCS